MNLGKGVIRGYDAGTGIATVEIVGGHPYHVRVPAASHLSAVQLVDGRRCAVLFFDELNPRDGVVVATYDVVADGPNLHHETHEVGGADEFSVAGLSGLLADGQNAVALQGEDVADGGPSDKDHLVYNGAANKWDHIQLVGADVPVGNHDHSGDAGDGAALPLTSIPGRWVWLTTPATSTAWDGDAKTTGNNGAIDLSAVFGLPAGIKAVALRISAVDETAGVYLGLGPSDTYRYAIELENNNTSAGQAESGIVPCDANGDINVFFSSEFDFVAIQIFGYCLP